MASSRRTYDTDVITLRTVFAKNVVNSNIPALRVLTADGAGGTYWAIPSSLGENPAFNEIITSAGTYTADLSYNRFRLLAGEGLGMVNGPSGSNQTTLYGKAFTTVDVSGDNAFYAFANNTVTPVIRVATTGAIQARSDPATNTLFIDGPVSNPYIVSTGQYGFYQIKVTPESSTITSSLQGWNGDYITANSPSTLLRFSGYNDIQLSTNVTTNSVFFTISTFTSEGYLNISTAAGVAYPNAISTVSSLYTPLDLFNSTILSISSVGGFGFSSVVSSINALAMSVGSEFYTLTGLIGACATLIELNQQISTVNLNIGSTVIGLGSAGYLSTGGGGTGDVTTAQLKSTVIGLGSVGYISTAGGGSGDVTTVQLKSTVTGLGSIGYLSSGGQGLFSTVYINLLPQNAPVWNSNVPSVGFDTQPNPLALDIFGSARILKDLYVGSTTTIVGTGGVSSSNVFANTVSSGRTIASSIGLINSTDGQPYYLQVVGGNLQFNSAPIGSGTVLGLLSTPNLTSTVGGLGQIYISTALANTNTISSGQITASSLFARNTFVSSLYASSIVNVNIAPRSSNLFVATGSFAGQNVKYSSDGINWSDAAGSKLFSSAGNGVGWNGSMWVVIGRDSTQAIKYSYDGINWTDGTGTFTSTEGYNVAWNGRIWLAVGNDTSQCIKYSYNGINWSNVPGSNVFNLNNAYGIAWNGKMWVAVGYDSSQTIKYSYDGLTWFSASGSNIFATSGLNVAWNGSLWVAVGIDGTQNVKYSYNGINWFNAIGDQVFSGSGRSIAWNGSLWIAVGSDSTQTIKYSYNGINWFSVPGSQVFSNNNCYSITWNGSIWVATGYDATQCVKYSYDGFTWLSATAPNVFVIGNGVAFNTNFTPSYNQTNFEIEPQNIPVFLRSTNQMSFTASSIQLNNTLTVDTTNKVGINTGTPQTELDVAGTGRFQIVSTQNIQLSSINGLPYTTGGGAAGYPSTVSTSYALAFNTSSFTVSSINGAGILSGNSLISTVAGLGQSYVSTSGLTSTVAGLGTVGYVSTASMYSSIDVAFSFFSALTGNAFYSNFTSTVGGLGQIYVSTSGLTSTVSGLGSAGYISSASLRSTVAGLGQTYLSTPSLVSTVANLGQTYLSTPSLVSTVSGLGSAGYISTASLTSTVAGLGSGGYPSTVSTSYALSFNTSSLTTSSINFVNVRQTTQNLWVAIGADETTANTLKYSSDGITWSNSSSGGFSASGIGIAYNGSMWVAVGNDSTQNNTIKYSTDGRNWSNSSGTGFTTGGNKVAWNGSYWVAVGEDSTQNNTIKYSTDSRTWLNSSGTGFTTSGNGIAWNGRLWVAVGSDSTAANAIKYSTNGRNWSNSSGDVFTGSIGNGVAWNGRIFVAVGSGEIMYSFNGITWTKTTTSFTTSGNGIAWNGNMWVAVGTDSTQNNTIKYSYDGINWFNSSGAAFTIGGTFVAWNGSLWVAVGKNNYLSPNGSIRYSRDGISWSSSAGSGFIVSFVNISEGYGVAYSSNVIPAYNQTNFEIEPQNIPNYLTSTNQLSFLASTIIANNTLFVDTTNRVGINTGNPQTDLDVLGTGRFITLSTQNIQLSSINGQSFGGPINSTVIGLGTTGYISTSGLTSTVRGLGQIYVSTAGLTTIPLLLSTGGVFTSSILASTVQASSIITSTITFGTIPGWVSMGAAQAVIFSSIQVNSALGYISSLYVGSTNTSLVGYTAFVNGPARIRTLLIGQPSSLTFQQPAFDLQLVANSAAKPVANTWSIGSDMRIKENVVDADIDRCYTDIKSVKLRRFTWKSTFYESIRGTDRNVLGFLAQEVSSIVPKTVEIKDAYGYSNFHFLNIDQLNMSLYGAVKRTIQDKEYLESTVKGQRVEIETLRDSTTYILSTLEGLQGR